MQNFASGGEVPPSCCKQVSTPGIAASWLLPGRDSPCSGQIPGAKIPCPSTHWGLCPHPGRAQLWHLPSNQAWSSIIFSAVDQRSSGSRCLLPVSMGLHRLQQDECCFAPVRERLASPLLPGAKRRSFCRSRPWNSTQEPLPAAACSPPTAARSPA